MNDKTDLCEKNVLLIAPAFFNYEKVIVDELARRGAIVTYANADPSISYSTLISIFKRFKFPIEKLIGRFEKKTFKFISKSGDKFDYFILICGMAITSHLVGLINHKLMNLDGMTVLYYWDSRKLLKDDVRKLGLFDRVYSFDKEDCKLHKPDMNFLPLFYVEDYIRGKNSIRQHIQYDIASVGSFKFDRYFMLKRMKDKNPGLRMNIFQYCNLANFIFHKTLRRKYRSIAYKDISFRKKSADEILNIYDASYAVLDIPRVGQNGLTMRTFECIAMGKKLITTNKNIVEYDFYDPRNIAILNDDLSLPSSRWFAQEYAPIDPVILSRYSISNWVGELVR